jgi:RND family efflux transporter MFP subunit
VGSEINFLNAKYAFEQAAAQLESINVDLANTRVKAPFEGRVERYLVNEGEMASAGMPLVRFIGSEKFVVAAGVPARYANVIRSGDVADIWFDDQDPDTLQGLITYVGRSINQQNRTFRIEVQLPEKEYSYKVDMVANLRLSTLSESNVIVLSEEFIYRKNDDYVVYLVSSDDQGNMVAEERFIELGPSYKTNVIVRNGLQAGEELITTGSAFLNDGMRIEVFDDNGQPIASQE